MFRTFIRQDSEFNELAKEKWSLKKLFDEMKGLESAQSGK
jgi:hypothetical protein